MERLSSDIVYHTQPSITISLFDITFCWVLLFQLGGIFSHKAAMYRDHVFADRSLLRHIGRCLRPRDDRWLCEFCAVHAPTYYTHRGYNHMTRVCFLTLRRLAQLRRERELFQASREYQDAFHAWLAQRPDRP